MSDWEVTVVTDSNYLKTVRVNDCITRQDAEAAALGMTGGKRVVVSNPKTYYNNDDDDNSNDYSSSSNSSDGAGILVIGAIALVVTFWKFILLVGIIALIIWFIWTNW